MQKKINLRGHTLEQIKSEFSEHGLTPLDAKRIFPWIHTKSAESFDAMSDLPLKTREILKEKFLLTGFDCTTLKESSDGTQKALLKLEDRNFIETVLIPAENRTTICISSQIGCAVGCRFCYTGAQKFTRNLTSSEIISQIFFWKAKHLITNIVFMGMGEPLLNYKNLASVLELLLNKKAHNFSRNKITVSTSGIVEDEIIDLAKFKTKLAISLHASNDKTRSAIMPVNKKCNIKNLVEIAKEYQKNSNTDYVTFEYLLLKGINDFDSDALELARLLRHIRCRVNLIMFNSWPGSQFIRSDKANSFSRILLSNGIRTIIRKSRGDDISAACGQLRSQEISNNF